jgi:hypothetical protein
MDDLGPATAVACGLFVAALTANAWLLHNGHAPLTALARSPRGVAVRRYFDAHCDGLLGPFDVFSHLGHICTRRLT